MSSKIVPVNIVRLEYLMEKKGWKNHILADKMNVDRGTIVNWKKGHSQPTLENLNKLAHVLGVDKQYLLDDDAQIAQKYLRKTVYATVDAGVQPAEVTTLLQILKALAIISVQDEKIIVQQMPPTEAETQRLGIMNATSKGNDTSDTE